MRQFLMFYLNSLENTDLFRNEDNPRVVRLHGVRCRDMQGKHALVKFVDTSKSHQSGPMSDEGYGGPRIVPT